MAAFLDKGAMRAMRDAVTIDDLDTRYREATWLITKRSGWAMAKALTLGSESLDALVEKIADLYELSSEERRRLRPNVAAEAQSGVGKAANLAKTLFGAGVTAEGGIKAAKTAYRAGRLGKTALTLVKAGPKAAQTMANTGRFVGKANPVIAIATAAYATGTTGWLAYHARAFNLASYELVKAREGLGGEHKPTST